MANKSNIIWHPFDVYQQDPLPEVVSAKDEWLYLKNGQKVCDLISSWWVNLHGHAHPVLVEALSSQAKQLEHVIFAGFTHKPAQELAHRLVSHSHSEIEKVFFSDNGSTAVEVALKMALQYHYNLGKPRTLILAFEGAYHGDTFGAMSVGNRNVFSKPFESMLFEVVYLPLPRDEASLETGKKLLRLYGSHAAAFIYEPLVQGAAGMRIYAAYHLDALCALAESQGCLLIADEVMTGFGRTGKVWATKACKHLPHLICLSKGITGGFMALGATLCHRLLVEAFADQATEKLFLHGHSYTGNPLACAVGVASFDLLMSAKTQCAIERISKQYLPFVEKLNALPQIEQCQSLGTILSIELKTEEKGYFSQMREAYYHGFLEKGYLIRPLGHVLYVLPPYCIEEETLEEALEVIYKEILRTH